MGFVDVKRMPDRGFAIVTLNRGPVNALSLEFLEELVSVIDSLEKDENIKGFILTSVSEISYSGSA